MKPALILTSLLIVLTSLSCKHSTEPEPQPGRRDYTWTVDTIKIPFNYLEKIWGDSPDNVWAVGSGGSSKTSIWKYNGTKWSTDNVARNILPNGIWGFGKNIVWAAGNEGRIWTYNGVDWKQSIWFTKQNWDVGFEEIWGDSPNSIFAVGYADSANTRHAEILKWDGKIWQEVPIPNFNTYDFIKIRRAANQQGNYFLLGWGEKSNGGDLLALFEFDGKNIWKIYENDFNSQTWSDVQRIGNNLLFNIGNRICKYIDGEFKTFFEIDINKYNHAFWGRNEKDIFISMKDGIAHYNGNDIQYLYKYTGSEAAFSAAVLPKDIFILTNDFNNYSNIIIRGKLP
ncbi:MAG: hypothetical protein ACOYU5_07365 [Stygiobacter sp.]|jgi:hypothetical protein